MVIEIVEHDPGWPDAFRSIGHELRRALGERALRIDHIGSTAVPGLAAKDVIDIQITVAALDGPVRAALEAAGLVAVGGVRADHQPPGLVLAPEQLEKLLYHDDGTRERRANIHVRVDGRFNQRYPLLCRDYLRAHPLAAAPYEEIKRALARIVRDDPSAYYAVKDPVFDLLMEGAREWAEVTAWEPGPSDA